MNEPSPQRNKILILEDNEDRIAGFQHVLANAFPEKRLLIWRDAPSMLAECEECLLDACLISLDHDLNRLPGATADPGAGREISTLLASHLPTAPVIIHSSNADAAWSMHNDLRFAGWNVERVGPIGDDWIQKFWLPKAREMIAAHKPVALVKKQSDHPQRLQRTQDSLEGLVLGDALGEMLAYRHTEADLAIARALPPAPWFRTDDGEMALSIVETLRMYGYVNQDALARRFARRFELDPGRGYGRMTYAQLAQINRGRDWRKLAAGAFDGQGSMGNGGAMRVAPVGAYFADDFDRVVEEAARSAEVTHTHPEGVAGAIAVAIAAAQASRLRNQSSENEAMELFQAVVDHTPVSKVKDGVAAAQKIPAATNIHDVAKQLGCGFLVTAKDTVPYAIWCAAHNLDNFQNAIITTILGGGDCDTNAAIVGGIVGAHVGREGIPATWRQSKEKLSFDQRSVA
jgi:ADP-ribosylglycohydrolase